MSNLIQKIGAEKVKHHLEVEIHYIRLKLPQSCQVSIEVQRGKKMHKETQQMNYSPDSAFIQFDYPIGFDITMHKKGNKYVKKNFIIKLFQSEGKTKTNNGRVKIDFSQIPVLKKPIIRREVPLQHCTDKAAVVSISVKLEQLGKNAKNINAGGISPNSSVLSPNSSLVTPNSSNNAESKKNLAEQPKKPQISDPLYIEIENPPKGTKKDVVKPLPKEAAVEIDDPYRVDDRDDSFGSMMSFSDLILNPKDSEVSSESSSSEEEVKELPAERLVAHAMPKVTRDQVKPNEASKAEMITRNEERGGITTRREGNCCSACISF